MSFTALCHQIFPAVIDEYHRYDDVDHPIANPYREGSIEHLLYLKNWIDTVQWHLEDLIRDPQIDPVEALVLKRRIDRSNQERTDMVEYIDSYFLDKFKDVAIESGAKINTESPAWAIDRLSILALKIYHMAQEVKRTDVSAKHVEECRRKLDILLQQRTDPDHCDRGVARGYGCRAQIHEGVQADEDVQRSRTESVLYAAK